MSVATYTYEALPAAEKKVLPKEAELSVAFESHIHTSDGRVCISPADPEQIRAEYRTARGHWDESVPAMTRTDDIAIRAPNVFIL